MLRTAEEWGGLLLSSPSPQEDWYDYGQGYTDLALVEVARIAHDEALEEAAKVAEAMRAPTDLLRAIRALKEGK